jgi:uncharacterized membrane-anchored protein
MRKIPHVTVLFWMLKIVATTLGETGGDLLAQTLHVGYLVSTIIFFALFLVAVTFQLKARRFHPAIFWTVIALTSTAGTTLSDLMNRTGGVGYTGGAIILSTGLAIVFIIWWRTGQTLYVENIATFKGELLYWVAILFSNSLGTSSGDFLADSLDSGSATARYCSPGSCWLCWLRITSCASTGWCCSGSPLSSPARSGPRVATSSANLTTTAGCSGARCGLPRRWWVS